MVSTHLLPSARMITLKHTRCLAITVMLLSALVITDVSYAAGRVFYDGFESGAVDSAWRNGTIFGDPVCPVVSTSVDGVAGPYAGTKMLQCAHGTGDSKTFEYIIYDTEDHYTDELFVRIRVRVDQDMDRSCISCKKLLRFFLSSGGVYHDMFAEIHTSNGLHNESHSQLNITENTYSGNASGDNTGVSSGWHQVEYYIRQSTGVMKVWYDDVQVRNEAGLNYVGVKWGPFFVGSNFHDAHDATNHFYIDEFEVYSDTGTGGTGLMSAGTITQSGSADTTPPTVPVNLRIQ